MNNSTVLRQQLFRYIIIGGLSTLINYCVFYILYQKFSVYYLTAHALGFSISVFFGYFFNKNWTYQSSNESKKEVVKYYMVYLFSLSLGLLLLKLLVDVLHLDPRFAKFIEIGITASTNFLGTKLWVFRK